MSYFDEMIATERIPDSYVGWEQYRREVTEYIAVSYTHLTLPTNSLV